MRLDTTGIDPTDHALARRCSVGDILTRSAATFGTRPVLHDASGSWSYEELESQANRFARGLADLGIEETDPVAIMSTNCKEFVAAYFGIAKAGMVALPVNLLLGAENIVHCLVDSEAPALVVHESLLELVLGAVAMAPQIRVVVVIGSAGEHTAGEDGPRIVEWDAMLSADDTNPPTVIADRQVVQCLYSSGTTSLPKGVLTSHLAVTVASLTNAAIFGVGWGAEPAVTTLVLPLFHTAGINGVMIPAIAMGGTIHLLAAFEPEEFARTVSESGTTHFTGLPLMLEALADGAEKGLDFSRLQRVLYAMAPMSQSTFDRVQAALPNAQIVLGSGMTECTPATVCQWPELNPDKTASWGYPSPSTENRIVEPNGSELLPRGEDGEIAYRGPTVMEGYYNRPEANAEVFHGGYMHSGDLGTIDAEGVLWFSDRVKDIVKSGGENISSLYVERVLLEHPDLAEAACIGKPDPKWGEQVVAVVVPKDPDCDHEALEQSVLEFGRDRFSSSQRPRSVVIVEALPRTATGKIRKVELRKDVP